MKIVVDLIKNVLLKLIPDGIEEYESVIEEVVSELLQEYTDDYKLTPAEIATVAAKGLLELAKLLPGAELEK